MPDIKIKPKTIINKIDKARVGTERIKSSLIDIKQLLDEGLIERVRRGYYHWIQDNVESEIVIINRLFPDAVLCMETAIFYYKYSDRNPAEWNFSIDKNVSKLLL